MACRDRVLNGGQLFLWSRPPFLSYTVPGRDVVSCLHEIAKQDAGYAISRQDYESITHRPKDWSMGESSFLGFFTTHCFQAQRKLET